MKMLLFDTTKDRPQLIDTRGGLAEYYRLLNCDLIDITSRQIGGRYFDIICDDEGLLKPRAKATALDSSNEPVLVGNLLVCNCDADGNETGLTAEDIEHLGKYIALLTHDNEDGTAEAWAALHHVED